MASWGIFWDLKGSGVIFRDLRISLGVFEDDKKCWRTLGDLFIPWLFLRALGGSQLVLGGFSGDCRFLVVIGGFWWFFVARYGVVAVITGFW